MKYEVIRSNRKSLAIQLTKELTVVVRAPYGVSDEEIDRIVREKNEWIKQNLKKIRQHKEEQKKNPPFTESEIRELAQKALEYIPKRVEYYAPLVGVDYRSITIRNQKTRWGSCSGKGGLNFNCLLMMTPPEVIDYVVVHELCHRKEMNHSQAFWQEVEKILPNYQDAKRWLKEKGGELIERI